MVSNVVVLTTHGRRVNIKVQPDTTLMKILEDVCQKFEFSVEEHDLKHHNKVLDLSMIMRFSGLPNNANLEMCKAAKKRTESSVTVLVQQENGKRLTGEFVPSDCLWQVISTLCNEDLASMSNPVIIFTRTELSGEEKMKATTLRSLGLTGGRAMFRLLDRTQEQLRQQANVSAPLPRAPAPPSPPPRVKSTQETALPAAPKPEPPEPKLEPTPGPSQPTPGPSWSPSSGPPRKTMRQEADAKAKLEAEAQKQQEQMDKEVEKELVVLGERSAVVFNRLASDPRLTQEEDLPSDFFEMTLEDAKRLMRDLRQKREEMDEQPIKTAAMRELEENTHKLALLQKYRHTVLRIHFLDGIVLQASFRPVESAEAVYTFLRTYLREPEHAFELYTAPPKRVLQPEDRLIEVGCVPGAILHFSSTAHTAPFLQQQLMDQMSSPAAALLAARRSKTT